LPLANASANPDAEYLSDGIAESIISSLSQLPRLRVMARSTVFRYKGQEVDPRKVGHDLHVDAVLTGSLIQRGETLIIKTELVKKKSRSRSRRSYASSSQARSRSA
jgi:serine/threonine-protein kinase